MLGHSFPTRRSSDLLNALAYAFYVYPLSQRVANVVGRTNAAEQSLNAARQEHAQAAGTLTGKDRASTELTTFYKQVLPTDLAGARRLTHLRLAQLARASDLRYGRATVEPVVQRNSTLTKLRVELQLAGTYNAVRNFIHELEAAPEFVVIDNLRLTEQTDTGMLTVRLELSTYYQDAAK